MFPLLAGTIVDERRRWGWKSVGAAAADPSKCPPTGPRTDKPEREPMIELTPELIAELQAFDTPTVCNALEMVAPRRRGYGFTTEPLVCTRPGLKPMVGIVRTATIRSAHPSDLAGPEARALADAYYAYIDAGPKPAVIVIQDIDEQKGYGAFWGEVN